MYAEWGFSDCPFETEALKPDSIGDKLLVGRDREISSFNTRLQASKKLVTFDGANGVGKTSLVNIALYRSYTKFLTTPISTPLFIACRTVFQLDDIDSISLFKQRVILEIAQTLVEKKAEISASPKTRLGEKKVDELLDEETLDAIRHSINELDSTRSTHTLNENENSISAAPTPSLERTIQQWLTKTFTATPGGIVCVLDNLELLQTSKKARTYLESLRDTIFNIKGIRWVLCGANNIILSVAASPRLSGFLENPIEIKPLGKSTTTEIFTSRLQAYERHLEKTYLPLNAAEFELLYTILNYNLRTTLSKCHDYCIYIYESNFKPIQIEEKKTLFEKWLKKEADSNEQACRSLVKPKAFEVFDKAAKDMGGSFSPSQYDIFCFESVQALRPHVKELEDAGLLISQIDEDDNRRKTIMLTPKGWLVNYSRLLNGKRK